MQLSHHYIQNKNLTFNSWLKNLKKKKKLFGVQILNKVYGTIRWGHLWNLRAIGF